MIGARMELIQKLILNVSNLMLLLIKNAGVRAQVCSRLWVWGGIHFRFLFFISVAVGGEHCYPTETTSNNFIAIRTMEGDKLSNMLYAEYQNGSQARMDIDFTDIAYYEVSKSFSFVTIESNF